MDIYISGSFGIETTIDLTDEQADQLRQDLYGLPIYVTLPGHVAELLNVSMKQSDWIDEVEIE